MSVFTSANTVRATSLNGWWDFCPATDDDPMLVLPTDAWEEDVYLAPSSWTGPGAEAFGYPASWGQSRQGWLRRFIRVAKRSNRRTVLQFDGVGPRATVFLNGSAVGETLDSRTPFEVDLTDVAQIGPNELVVRILDTPRDHHGLARHPAGRDRFTGIREDVRLIERSEVHVAHVAIRPSVRKGSIEAEVTVANASRRPRTVTVHNDVLAWKKTLKPATAKALLDLGTQTVEVPPRETVTYTVRRDWPEAPLWSPETPHLLWLRFRIEEGGHALYVQGERFGFREVWTEGASLQLNGRPLRLFSDHGPTPKLHHGTEAWIRHWFALLRSLGLTHAKVAGACGGSLLRRMADEHGILLTVETALDGEADHLATHTPEFWVHAADHVRHIILRDRNHPSVILWSVGHRLLTDLTTPSPAFRELPRLRALIRELDPTRPGYFDADSMHWAPARQDLLDGPPGRFESIYDAPERPRLATAFSDIVDAQRYILLARANGTTGIAVQSPLAYLPMIPEREIELAVPDPEAPGLKLPRVPAGSSELPFWSTGKKPELPSAEALGIFTDAFRRIAVLDTTPATGAYPGTTVVRRVVACNDSPNPVEGTLEVTLRLRDESLCSKSIPVDLQPGERLVHDFACAIPANAKPGPGRIDYLLSNARGRKLDQRRTAFRIARPARCTKRFQGRTVAVYGPGQTTAWLERTGFAVRPLEALTQKLPRDAVVLLEAHTVTPGSDCLPALREFVEGGGALVLLEQEHSLFQGLALHPRAEWLAKQHDARHPVWANLTDDDLVCWCDVPIAMRPFLGTDPAATPLATDSGGDTGTNTLMLELRAGKGMVLASQLRIVEALDSVPAAGQLLYNLLTTACAHRAQPAAPETRLLDGLFTPVPAHDGKGYPETFWMRNAPTSAAVAERLIEATVRANADYPPVQTFSVADQWQAVHRTDGWTSAVACSLASPIYLYSRFHAEASIGTLQLEGEGHVTVAVGGRLYEAELGPEPTATIQEIALEPGYNAVLMLWKPLRADSRLRGVWVDSDGEPERTFQFA